MDEQYYPGSVVPGHWTLTRLIGAGSFGRVFEAQRKELGGVRNAAMKIVTIPRAHSDDLSATDVAIKYKNQADDLKAELTFLSEMDIDDNIANYEGCAVITHKDGTGWDFIICMELLTPLPAFLQDKTIAQRDVIELGIAVCKALEFSQKYGFTHGNIKFSNIFVGGNGEFKLGDFGFACLMGNNIRHRIEKGAAAYMAPEVLSDHAHDVRADMYSLGIVLYRLLNNNRPPFFPAYPQPVAEGDMKRALLARLGGAELPKPGNASDRLSEIVSHACAFDPAMRYESPALMRRDLEAMLAGNMGSEATTTPISKKPKWFLFCLIALLAPALIIFLTSRFVCSDENPSNTPVQPTVGMDWMDTTNPSLPSPLAPDSPEVAETPTLPLSSTAPLPTPSPPLSPQPSTSPLPIPTPTTTPTSTPTSTPTPTPTSSPSLTPSDAPTRTPTPDQTPSPTPTLAPSQQPTSTPAQTITVTVSYSYKPMELVASSYNYVFTVASSASAERVRMVVSHNSASYEYEMNFNGLYWQKYIYINEEGTWDVVFTAFGTDGGTGTATLRLTH